MVQRTLRFRALVLSILVVLLRLLLNLVMARPGHLLASVILMARTVGRAGRVIRRADRRVRTRAQALCVRRQRAVRAAVLTFELRRLVNKKWEKIK